MEFLRGLGLAGGNASDPPPSVLSEWNKYSAGDIEAGDPKPAQQGASTSASYIGSLQGVTFGFPGSTAGQSAPASTTSIPSFRIPSGTDFVYFAALVCGAIVFFFMAFFVFLPMLVFAPAKFALSFTFGSLCTMAAMNMLSGWRAGVEHMFSADRRLFTAVYLGSMFATIYAALFMHSYLLSLTFSVVQVLALAFYVVSYFPGGAQGMQFMLGLVGRSVSSCFGSFTRASS